MFEGIIRQLSKCLMSWTAAALLFMSMTADAADATFTIHIDATNLTGDQMLLSGAGAYLNAEEIQTFQLNAGTYSLYQAASGIGISAAFSFTVQADGTVSYAADAEGFLDGIGSDTLTVVGYPITVDATRLTADLFRLRGVAAPFLNAEIPQTIWLIPSASYVFDQAASGIGPSASFVFGVAADGTIAYDTSAEGFLDGMGSDTLTVVGYPITVDATGLTADLFRLRGVAAPFLNAEIPQPIRLIPSAFYVFDQAGTGIGPSASFVFGVAADGTITYAAAAEGFLDGKGSPLLKVSGYRVTIAACPLTSAKFRVRGVIKEALDAEMAQYLHVVPGSYVFDQIALGIGPIAAFMFDVDENGNISYDNRKEGFLDGRGTSTLMVAGYTLRIDGRDMAGGEAFRVYALTECGPKDVPQAITVVPGEYAVFQCNGVSLNRIVVEDDGVLRVVPGSMVSVARLDGLPPAACLGDLPPPLVCSSGYPIYRDSPPPTAVVSTAITDSCTEYPGQITLALKGSSEMTLECGVDVWMDPGAEAWDAGCTPLEVHRYNSGSDPYGPGPNTCAEGTYSVQYAAWNAEEQARSAIRTVNVDDRTPPSLKLKGTSYMTHPCGSGWLDPGVEALDACYGDVAPAVRQTGWVNGWQEGSYAVRYEVTDSGGNSALPVTRTVEVIDCPW
jgi:hypothetical protein